MHTNVHTNVHSPRRGRLLSGRRKEFIRGGGKGLKEEEGEKDGERKGRGNRE